MYEEILNSLIWYYSKANASLAAILDTRPPTTEDHLRLHYGSYIESILSAIDYMKDRGYLDTEIHKIISKEEFAYFRELRNSIVHRGFNMCTECTIHNDFFYFRTPQEVSARGGKETPPPKEQFLIIFLLKIDILIRNLIHEKIQNLGLLEYKEVSVDDMFNGLAAAIKEHHHIPQNIKELFFNNTDAIRESLNPKEMHNSLVLKYHQTINLENMMENFKDILQNLTSYAETLT